VKKIGELGTTLAVTGNRTTLRRLFLGQPNHAAKVVPGSPIIITLMMEALRYSRTSVLARLTWCKIPEDGILHSHHVKISNRLYTMLYLRTSVV
jgi:hypothetical protein